MLVIGADLGGTGARASLAEDGHILAQTELLGVTDRAQTVNDLVTELLARSHVRAVDTIALGATGFAMNGAELRERLPQTLLGVCRELILCSDMVSSYFGAVGLAPGAVIAAGTGAVALGTDLRGTWRRVDGWGYLVGDHGGGSWIGRQALSAALRCADARPGGSPVLLEALKVQFGEPSALVALLASRADRAGVMAGFVPAVKAAAVDGDVVAQQILSEAGVHLAESAIAALPPAADRHDHRKFPEHAAIMGARRGAGGGEVGGGEVGGATGPVGGASGGAERVVATTGNLFQVGALLTDSFHRALGEAGVRAQAAKGSSVDGALVLAAAAKSGNLPPNTPCEQFTSRKG